MTYQTYNPLKLLSTADVGDLLYDPQLSTIVKQKRVMYLIKTNKLPMTKINKKWMIPYKKLVEWQEKRFK
tara:strand:+ start:725 stop:934 length:210 start_codon:yes stop_codon:yes gene_type:complete